jgi:CBS domain containing-hemolysin-like protein
LDILNLVIIAILIALTAFFVTSEFAIVKVRTSRIDQLIEEGNKNAVAAKKIITNLDEYLSACQLGITVTALGIGALGEPTFEHLLQPVLTFFHLPDSLTSILSIAFAFAIMTFLHVVVGELAPKTVAIQKTEKITLLTARPLIAFYRVMYPFIWLLNGSARLITGLFGLKRITEHEVAHSEEELRIILSDSYKNGEINQSEFKYVNKIFEFDDRIAKEIMVPRTEMVSLSKDQTLEDFLSIVHVEKFTRFPVIDGDKDHIIGLINLKEVLTDILGDEDLKSKTLKSYIRPIIKVIENAPIHDLLVKMQKERIHMAILMDEYGGTSGLVTAEDIIEEIVGEIRIESKVLISEVNDLLNLDINDEDIDTIGGWILTENYEAKQGDIINLGSYSFKIIDMEDHHVKYVEVTKIVNDEEKMEDPLLLLNETENANLSSRVTLAQSKAYS